MRAPSDRLVPLVCSIALFLVLVALISPWANLPLNDDWQYAHLAKSLEGRGTFAVDTSYEAKTLIGQAAIAWPVIRIFGFSHLALRLLTLLLSIFMLAEVDYLLVRGAVPAGVRFIALSSLVANPFFLHFSTTFLTENYGYFVALLAACVWFRGRDRDSAWLGVVAAAIAGFSFWIRQFSALIFPALVLAEVLSTGAQAKPLQVVRRRMPAIAVWSGTIVAYFLWARATGNYIPHLAGRLGRILTPSPLILFVELGIFVFYMTVFFGPFLVAPVRRQWPSIKASIIPGVLLLTAGFAWIFGDSTGLPRANLRFAFPFLRNVLTSYGVGPLTLTDVYIGNSQTRPTVSNAPWLLLEAIAIAVSFAWGGFFARAMRGRSEVGIFGICFALISFIAVVFYFQFGMFDRYHYSGILGFTLAAAVFFPREYALRLSRWALPWIGMTAAFSTLALHDYFRWNEARAELVADARGLGITPSQIDAGLELNAWNSVEGLGASGDCDGRVNWFCAGRPYRIGLQQAGPERLITSRPVNAWLVYFPDLKLLGRP